MDYLKVCVDQLCEVTEIQAVHLLPPEASTFTDLLVNGGFDPELARLGFVGVMLLWASGLAVGLIISHLRKTRV